MGVAYHITLSGAEKITFRLESIRELTQQELSNFLEDIAVESIAIFKDYPPETYRNQPPPPYYQRGVGYYGQYGTLTKSSQQLGTRWSYAINSTEDSVVAEITNTATYAQYVHGDDDQPQLPWAAIDVGWPNAKGTLAKMIGDKTVQSSTETVPAGIENAEEKFDRMIERIANRFNE